MAIVEDVLGGKKKKKKRWDPLDTGGAMSLGGPIAPLPPLPNLPPPVNPKADRFVEVSGATGTNTIPEPPQFGNRGRDDWGIGGRDYEREELRRQRKI